ncbi:MAG TPA: PD-(D/E)XK nuclease family protein [Sedimentisphaerales bacterium]|nr:PD-(D/E)XK nuclease family protein [Sedimentisphaerales bacterium]
MAVQFILGRSGTGKTSHCIKAIVNALLVPGEERLILLVPEQASYQAERAILADRRIAGYNRLKVLSFDRLQFLLLGKNTARPALTRIGQQMIVHRLLRENCAKLKLFGSSAGSTGMARRMADTISELHQYAKTPEEIDRLLSEFGKDERNSLAALKFADIELILKEYLKAIEGRFSDPDIQLNQACRAAAEADFVRGAKLWVDGFAGFTTAELAILAELLKAAADTRIALCLDPSKLDVLNPAGDRFESAGLFSPTEQTYCALVEIVKNNRLSLSAPIILRTPVRFSRCRELAHIEQNIFELKAPKTGAADNVRIVSTANARAEVQFVAGQIRQLVKAKDYRYRDIAVIASDIDRYQHYIRAYFDDCGIPFFIDKRRPLSQHPAVHLICSALQVVTGDFSHHDVFSYLKTDLAPAERYDVDLLENYCLAFGVTGADWQSDKDWHFAGGGDDDFDERRVNQIRRELSEPLLKLQNALRAGGDGARAIGPGEFTKIIFDFLDGLQVRQRLGKWIEKANEAGEYTAADEHRQFYDKLVTVFDELAEVFAGQELTIDDYVAILNSAFSQLTLAFIPPTLDQVLVGSVERSRHPDLKAAFLIGATQREFPTPVSLAGILTDDDRTAADSADFPLAATVRQKLVERQYLAYIAFTRPAEFLCVTYPLVDDKGSPECRSRFVDNLTSLFDGLSEQSVGGEPADIENVRTEHELADLLCSELGKDARRDTHQAPRDGLDELLDDICADKELSEAGLAITSAVTYDNRARLDENVVKELFGRELDSSATRLSTFAGCPYQYFARYVLELAERKEFKFEPLDLGVFYHRVLDSLLKKLKGQKKDFATIGDEQLLKLLREQIAEIVQTDPFISHFAGHSLHNAFIISSAGEVLEDCVRAIAQMVRAGSFRPSLSEVWFGQVRDGGESLGEYKVRLSNNRVLLLDGKIDRLDVADVNGRQAVIIFDYKRRAKSFSWSEFYYGLDMQLPLYMLAVRNAFGGRQDVVGAFYMPVEVNPGTSTLEELSSATEAFGYKAKGIFNGEFFRQLDKVTDSGWSKFYSFRIAAKEGQYGNYGTSSALKPSDFDEVLRFTEKKAVELAEEIISGRIDVNPYRLGGKSPCSYCEYKPVCRFDWQINDYHFLESLTKPAALVKMSC